MAAIWNRNPSSEQTFKLLRTYHKQICDILHSSGSTLESLAADLFSECIIDERTKIEAMRNKNYLSVDTLMDTVRLRLEQTPAKLDKVFEIMYRQEALHSVVMEMKTKNESPAPQTCGEEDMETLSTSSEVSNFIAETDEVKIVFKARALQNKFHKLLVGMIVPLENVDVQILRLKISCYFDCTGKSADRLFKTVEKIYRISEPNEILNHLILYKLIKYLNYRLLCAFQESIRKDEFDVQIKDYEIAHDEFLHLTDLGTLAKVFKNNPDIAPATYVGLPQFTVHLNESWEGKSAYQWADLLNKQFSWPPYIHITHIIRGSIAVVYSVLPFFAHAVVRDLTDPLFLSLLKRQGVINVELSDELIEMGMKEEPEQSLLTDQSTSESITGENKDDYKISLDADHLKKNLFDEQQFFDSVEAFLSSDADEPTKANLLMFLLIENYNESQSGWLAQYPFKVLYTHIELEFLHLFLKSEATANKLYLILLEHQMKPAKSDFHFAMMNLKDEAYNVFEAIIEKFHHFFHVNLVRPRSMAFAIQHAKYHFAGVCCKSCSLDSAEIMNFLCCLPKQVCNKNIEKFLSHISSQARYELIELIVTRKKNFHYLVKRIYRSGQTDMNVDCFLDLLMKNVLFFLEHEKLLLFFLDSFTTNYTMQHIGKLNKATKLLLKVSTSKHTTDVIANNGINAVVYLFKTKGVTLSVIELNKMCSTPVHAAAMISVETGCLDLLSYVCEVYEFPANGEIVNSDNETPFHIVLKWSSKKQHITSVCEILQATNRINPYILDKNEKTAKDYCKHPDRKSLMQKAEKCWETKMYELSNNKSCDSESTSISSKKSELHSINGHKDGQIPSNEQVEIREVSHAEKQKVASDQNFEVKRLPRKLHQEKNVKSSISSFQKQINELLSNFDGIFSPHLPTDEVNVKVQGDEKLNDEETKVDLPQVEPVPECSETDRFIVESSVDHACSEKLTENLETADRHVLEKQAGAEWNDKELHWSWEVLISKQASDFLKADKIPKNVVDRIREVLEKIRNGDRSKAIICRYLQPEDKLYETKIFKGARLLWQESIEYSVKLECYTDVVKVLWITLRHNKTQLNDVIWQVKTALAKSRKCHYSKSLVLIDNPHQDSQFYIMPRRFLAKDYCSNISQNEDIVFHRPTPNVYDGEFSVMQFHSFDEFLDVIASEDPSKQECPIQMSEEEHKILKLPYSTPILLSGRSGTGKTTTCLYRLWNVFKEYWTEKMQELERCVHQIFVTKSPVLCSKVGKQFDKLLFGKADMPENFNRTPIKDVHKIEKLGHEQFPLFLTFHQFLLLLDSSLPGGSFFPRSGEGELLINICNSDYNESKDPNALFEDLDEELQDTNVHSKWTVVTADYFSRKLWAFFGDNKLDSLLVWTEIQSFIKGSHEALMSGKGYLTREEYLSLGKKQAPMFYDEYEAKSFIYDCFEKYEKHKKDENYKKEDEHFFDENDFVHHIYHRLENYKKDHQPQWYIDEFYIDEIQDFTQSELCLLLLCSCKANKTFCTGDIAQTIMKGIHFRFEDLKSQFWKLTNYKERNDLKVHYLTQNFRSHSGILNLGQSILEILRNRKYFHYSYLDGKIGNEEAVFTGPKPILLDTSSPTDLVSVMLGSGDDSSVVHELGAHQAIIVRSQEEKDNLPDSLKSGIVLTVFESKGLEFNDVLLYNFFSGMKNEVPIPWMLLNNLIEKEFENESEKKQSILPYSMKMHIMNDKREKQLKSLNAELKHLYMAITRARKNLWIYDESTELRMPAFYYWQMKDLVTVAKIDDIYENTLLFAASSEKKQWEKQGDLFFKMRKWKLAMVCYEKANKISQVSLTKGYMLVEEAAQSPKDHDTLKDLYTEAALHLLKAGIDDCNEEYFKKGILCLQKAGLHSEGATAAEKIKDYDLARAEWFKARNYYEVARLDELMLNYSQAVRCFLKQKDYESALSKAIQFETNGESLDFDVRSQQVANEFLKEKIAVGKYGSEDVTIVSEFISSGVIKAGFLEQIGLYDLAVDELVKEDKLRDAYMLIKRKSLFIKGSKEPRLCENHRTEFLFFHFMHLLTQNANNVEIMECFTQLQQPSVPPFYQAHSLYVMAKSSKEAIQCHKALKLYTVTNNSLGRMSVYKLLMDIGQDDYQWNEYFKMAKQAHEVAKHFKLGNIYTLRQAMEFYFMESVDVTTYSIVTLTLENFFDEFQNLCDSDTDEGLVIIDKKQVHDALHNHYLKLSRSFMESIKVSKHYEVKICPEIKTAPFYNGLCSGVFDKSFLHIKFNFENYFKAVRNVAEYYELLGYYPSAEINTKALINFLAPFAAYSIPSHYFQNWKSSKFVCEYMKRRAIDVVSQESVNLDDFLLAWRILAVSASSYEGRGIINSAMSKISTKDTNENPIHIFNGLIVSLKQMYYDGKIIKSIWSMYNYVFTRIARIDDLQRRDAVLSVGSITYTISVFSTALMSMIVIAHCALTPGHLGPLLLLPDFYQSLVYNHDSIYTQHYYLCHQILHTCFYEVMPDPLESLQKSTYQLKTLLMFLVGQDKNKYNILQVALKSVSCHRDGSALYCLSLCLILATNLFKYYSVDQYNEKEKRSMQDLLLTIHKTVLECNCFGKSHFISLAYNELNLAQNTSDLYILVKKLLQWNTLNVSLKRLYLLQGNDKIQFDLVVQHSFPKYSIKALVIIEKPSDEEQEKLENDKDPEGDNISNQQLLEEIKDLQGAILVESPYIKKGQCSVCGCEVEIETQVHLNSKDHLSNEELFMKFSRMISEISELLQYFQKEMKNIEESIIEVDILLKECECELQKIKLIEMKAKENCTWRDGIDELTEISLHYQQRRKKYHDIKETFLSTREQVLQFHDNVIDLDSILPETQTFTLKKEKR